MGFYIYIDIPLLVENMSHLLAILKGVLTFAVLM